MIFIQHWRFESNTANTAIWHQEFFHGLKTKIIHIISPQHHIKSTSLCNENLPGENQKPDALFSVACNSACIWDRNWSEVLDSHELLHFPPEVSASASGSCAYVQAFACV